MKINQFLFLLIFCSLVVTNSTYLMEGDLENKENKFDSQDFAISQDVEIENSSCIYIHHKFNDHEETIERLLEKIEKVEPGIQRFIYPYSGRFKPYSGRFRDQSKDKKYAYAYYCFPVALSSSNCFFAVYNVPMCVPSNGNNNNIDESRSVKCYRIPGKKDKISIFGIKSGKTKKLIQLMLYRNETNKTNEIKFDYMKFFNGNSVLLLKDSNGNVFQVDLPVNIMEAYSHYGSNILTNCPN